MLWEPSPAFTAKLKYAYGRDRQNGENNQIEPYCAASTGFTNVSTRGGQIQDPLSDCKLNYRRSYGDFPVGLLVNMPNAKGGVAYSRLNSHLGSFEMNYSDGPITATSITGYYKFRSQYSIDQDVVAITGQYSTGGERARAFSQELRLASDYDSPVNFVFGAFYDDTRFHPTASSFYGVPQAFDPVAGKYYGADKVATQTGNTYSAFGQLRWKLVDTLELSAGVRYTKEKKHTTQVNAYVNPGTGFPLRAQGNVLDLRFEDSNWSPEVTLNWRPDTNNTLYVSYKTGYKSGGTSIPSVLLSTYTPAALTYQSEENRGGEVGYKASLLDHKVRLDLVAYRYTLSNLQVSSFIPAFQAFFIGNAAKARTSGIEVEGNLRATRGLSLNTALGYNKAVFQSFRQGPCYNGQTAALGCTINGSARFTDLTGKTLPRAPRWSLRFGANYEAPITDAFVLKFGGEGIYTSHYNPQDNLDPRTEQDDFWRLNANVGIGTTDGRYELSLIGRNLTDVEYLNTSVDKTQGRAGEYLGNVSRPREILLQGAFRF